MSIVKITELPAADSPVAPAEVLPIVQNGVTKKASIDQLSYIASGTNTTPRTIQNKLRETVSVKDFGAVGDGVTDDTLAIQNAFNASAGKILYGVSGESYRITSTINVAVREFDGRGCSFTKDFAGIGISVTGGAAFSYLRDFSIFASGSYSATDYVAGATQHGIQVTNTRVEMFDVLSSGHIGAGFNLVQTGPNANKSKYIRIRATGCALAGCRVDGNYPTADDFSVVEFNGQFQSNYGYGMLSTDTAPIRQWVCWIYGETNHLGVSAPDDGTIRLNAARGCDIWCYAEQPSPGTELVLGTNAINNVIRSVRRNRDSDSGSDNRWISGANIYVPFVSTGGRSVTGPGFRSDAARVTNSGEYLRIPWTGNNGTFGFVEGAGVTGSSPQIRLLSADGTKIVGVNNSGGVLSASSIANTRIADELITSSGHFIRAGGASFGENSTVDIDLIENANNFYFGKVTCIVTSSGAAPNAATFYEVDFTYDGTTLTTAANSLNAANALYSASLALSGAKIRLSVGYTTSAGSAGRYWYKVDVVGRSR
jgi:hypothetical protein